MKFTMVIIIALACVLSASIAFAQAPSAAARAQQAKKLHQQKIHQLITPTQKALLHQKTPIVLKAMAKQHNKRGFAKIAHSAKIDHYSKSYTTKGQSKHPVQTQQCKNGVCPLSHDPSAH